MVLSAAVNQRINQKALFSAPRCPNMADRASISFPFEMTQNCAIFLKKSKKKKNSMTANTLESLLVCGSIKIKIKIKIKTLDSNQWPLGKNQTRKPTHPGESIGGSSKFGLDGDSSGVGASRFDYFRRVWRIGEDSGEENRKKKFDIFSQRWKLFELFVASRSERICIEHPNPINLSSPFAQISSRASHFRLMYQRSVWRCKHAFSTASNSIERWRMVRLDFTKSG